MKNSINRLYSFKKWQKKTDLQVKVKGYSDTFDIDLTDNKGVPDCVIGHFGYNFYIRTPKGLTYSKYKNLRSMVGKLGTKETILKHSFDANFNYLKSEV